MVVCFAVTVQLDSKYLQGNDCLNCERERRGTPVLFESMLTFASYVHVLVILDFQDPLQDQLFKNFGA